jgi:hypothetical protein
LKGDNLKKILAFVILVVLALALFNVLSLPNVRAQTNEAQVLSYSWYIAPSTTTTAEYINDLIAVGEVQNTGSTTIGAIWVTGQAYDSNGTVLASTEAQAMATNLVPNQKVAFYLDFTPEESVTQDQSWVPNVTSVTVSVATITNASDSSTQYTGLTTSNLNIDNNGGNYTVSGIIQNTGDQSVEDVALASTFYNSNGTVIAVSFTDLGATLVPRQPTTFEVTPWDNTATLSSEIENYTILVQSIPVTPTATPEQTAQPTTQPTSSPSGSPNPTQNPGIMTSIPTYALVIVVIAVVAIIAGLMLLRRRGKSYQIEASTSPQPSPPQP